MEAVLVLLFVPVLFVFLAGVGAFLLAGLERKTHPWESWGLDDEPKR